MIEKNIEVQKIVLETTPDATLESLIESELEAKPALGFVKGQLVDIKNRSIFPAEVFIKEGKIIEIKRVDSAPDLFILPGFVDAHIHIESSMLTPAEFSKIAVLHGTVATVSDPHEIANVCGVEGIDFMIQNAALSPLKFNFGAPSCVPATNFETSGAVLDASIVSKILARPEIKYLSEVMNFPGVLSRDAEVMAKIQSALKLQKPVDGHAPGLTGIDMEQYAAAGITTDHECIAYEEAVQKIKAGMLILIREGSAAKNFDALVDLFSSFPKKLMFCSDDKHPDDLLKGHINQLVVRAIAKGYNLFDVLHAACILPVNHYHLNVGLLNVGDPADFIVVEDLKDFKLSQTYINGNLVAQDGICLFETEAPDSINNFKMAAMTASQFKITTDCKKDGIQVLVIAALDGQLITRREIHTLKVENGEILADPDKDILYIGVVDRYHLHGNKTIGFVKNFGLKNGAIASSVAHDSHNIVFVGCDQLSICNAVNALIEKKGGISVAVAGGETKIMPLPIAGLMTNETAVVAAQQYEELDTAAKKLGSSLSAPFMTLSFMALPVIPSLKITDQGLFDVDQFCFIDLEVKQ